MTFYTYLFTVFGIISAAVGLLKLVEAIEQPIRRAQ